MSLVKPAINMNGTAASDLLDGYIKAMNAIQAASNAVARTSPNGRDYQTVHPDNLRHAMLQHSQRLQKLDAIRAELGALAEHAAHHVH